MPAEDVQRLITEKAAEFRASLIGESRSATLAHLLNFLVERSSDTRPPKEIEIAMVVFGKAADFDTSQDSTVRVHIHRLRQRLESFNAGKRGPLLNIPKGGYRLLLVSGPAEDSENAPSPKDSKPHSGNRRAWTAATIGLAATALLWMPLFHALGRGDLASEQLALTSFWKPVVAHERLPVIAAGDFYMAVESGTSGKIERLSARLHIRSPRDLDNYLRDHPQLYDTLQDREIYRVPAMIATGSAALSPLLTAMSPDRGVVEIVPVSQLSQERIETNNIIYIIHFSDLGRLRALPPGLSSFTPEADVDEVRDLSSGRTYAMRPPNADDPYGYDYGYLASYSGPSGSHMIIISGIGDIALNQMIKLVSDKRRLDLISREIGGGGSFEALYQVRTAGRLIADTTLLTARPLKTVRRPGTL